MGFLFVLKLVLSEAEEGLFYLHACHPDQLRATVIPSCTRLRCMGVSFRSAYGGEESVS
jgi:hypothetical protein